MSSLILVAAIGATAVTGLLTWVLYRLNAGSLGGGTDDGGHVASSAHRGDGSGGGDGGGD